jgi:hypothetical protein
MFALLPQPWHMSALLPQPWHSSSTFCTIFIIILSIIKLLFGLTYLPGWEGFFPRSGCRQTNLGR